MSDTAKLLVLGPPAGPQSTFVSSISEVRVKSSTHNPSGQGFVPMDFGRVRLDSELDLQLFGFDRDQITTVADAVSPGIVGAVVFVTDPEDPHYALAAMDELGRRRIPFVIAAGEGVDDQALARSLAVDPSSVIPAGPLDREAVKAVVVRVLEEAMAVAEGSAA